MKLEKSRTWAEIDLENMGTIEFFTYNLLETIKENKFDILDEIKEIDTDETVSVTLSIAISNEGETNYEKYKSFDNCAAAKSLTSVLSKVEQELFEGSESQCQRKNVNAEDHQKIKSKSILMKVLNKLKCKTK